MIGRHGARVLVITQLELEHGLDPDHATIHRLTVGEGELFLLDFGSTMNLLLCYDHRRFSQVMFLFVFVDLRL